MYVERVASLRCNNGMISLIIILKTVTVNSKVNNLKTYKMNFTLKVTLLYNHHSSNNNIVKV